MQTGRPNGGLVVAVSIDARHSFGKTPRLSIALVKALGIQGDAHFGRFVRHRHLARRNPRAPNLRQVHLIPGELLEALRANGYDVAPGELGENITTTASTWSASPSTPSYVSAPTRAFA